MTVFKMSSVFQKSRPVIKHASALVHRNCVFGRSKISLHIYDLLLPRPKSAKSFKNK